MNKNKGRQAILDIDGKRLLSTGKNRAFHEEIITNWHKYRPDIKFVIESFDVQIMTVDPNTHITLTWRKEEGFSLWYSPVNALLI